MANTPTHWRHWHKKHCCVIEHTQTHTHTCVRTNKQQKKKQRGCPIISLWLWHTQMPDVYWFPWLIFHNANYVTLYHCLSLCLVPMCSWKLILNNSQTAVNQWHSKPYNKCQPIVVFPLVKFCSCWRCAGVAWSRGTRWKRPFYNHLGHSKSFPTPLRTFHTLVIKGI